MMRQISLQLAFLLLTMAAWASDQSRITVVLVDTSMTIKRYQPYQDAYKQVLATLKAGDHIVVWFVKGRALENTSDSCRKKNDRQADNPSSRAYAKQVANRCSNNQRKELASDTQLRVIENQDVPPCHFTDAVFDCQEKLDNANKALAAAFDHALQQPRSDHTALLATIDEAAKYFKQARQQERVLVLLSDMLEDSPEARFEVNGPTEKMTRDYIAARKQSKTLPLPELKKVRVYVAGAEAQNEGKLRNVENFWIEYLSAAGADVRSENYSNQLIGFQ
jgi:hypothetical protein